MRRDVEMTGVETTVRRGVEALRLRDVETVEAAEASRRRGAEAAAVKTTMRRCVEVSRCRDVETWR